jgi:arylsulfatase A
MTQFSSPLTALFLLCILSQASNAAEKLLRPAQDRPNFIIIFCDDMGYADIGPFGAEGYETPNLNRMAAEGMVFTDFHVGYAVCSPSRSAILTGCYPKRISVNGNFSPNSKTGLHPDEMTIADVLKQEDYATACFGKWHLGHEKEFLPTSQGFDEFYGVPYSHDMWNLHPENGTRYNFPVLPLYEGTRVIKTELTEEDQKTHTRKLTSRTVQFIEKNKNHPFFIYLPHPLPHVPLYMGPDFEGKTKRGTYGDVVEELDWSVGQILNTLDETGIRENTLVVFTSDNGPWLRYGDHGGSAGPLREGKGTFFEGGYRVPGIMSWPGKIEQGVVNNKFASTIDLLPTFATLAGASLPKNRPIDGEDIGPLLMGNEPETYSRGFLYWSGRRLSAVRGGKWKLVFPGNYTVWSKGGGGLPGHDQTSESIELSLFNLDTDVGETTNVIDQYPNIVARLQKFAAAARLDLGDAETPGKGIRPLGGQK